MTGYTVHTGSSKKFSDGWDRIFQDQRKAGRSNKQDSSTADAGRTEAQTKNQRKKK